MKFLHCTVHVSMENCYTYLQTAVTLVTGLWNLLNTWMTWVLEHVATKPGNLAYCSRLLHHVSKTRKLLMVFFSDDAVWFDKEDKRPGFQHIENHLKHRTFTDVISQELCAINCKGPQLLVGYLRYTS